MGGAVLLDRAQRHGLDQRQVMALRGAEAQHRLDLILVQAAQRHHVELDMHPRRLRRRDARQHPLQFALAGDVAEHRRIQRVEADIDAANPGRRQRRRRLGQPHAVGGHGQLVERARGQVAAQPCRQVHHAAPDERLAAGQAQPAHAARDERAGNGVDFLEAEQFGARCEHHLLGHAIAAAQVAAVGDRHAQIGDAPPERVDQRRLQALGCGGLARGHDCARRCGAASPRRQAGAARRGTGDMAPDAVLRYHDALASVGAHAMRMRS